MPPIPTANKPVPAPPVARMQRIASFKPGFWNGKEYTKAYIKSMYDNFQRFSTSQGGRQPWYVPYVNINHDDVLKFGRIPKAELAADGTLYLWAENLPLPVAEWCNAHQLDERSIEFIEPKIINGKKVGFVGPDGKVVDTPVLKNLSLLGSDVPAVKGLPPLPVATFSARLTSGRVSIRRFSSRSSSSMSDDLLNQLRNVGFDVNTLPPDATDELGKEILRILQTANANPPAGAAAGGGADGNPATQMANIQLPTQQATAPTVPATGTTGQQTVAIPADVSQVTMRFRDEMAGVVTSMRNQFAGLLAPINLQLNQLRSATAAATQNTNAINERTRDGIISKFCDDMGKTGQISPAMRPAVERQLKKCEFLKVRKFADGKSEGTELEELMNEIRTTYPVQRSIGPKVGQPNVTNAGNAAGGGGMDPERKRKLLETTPEGRAAIKSGVLGAAK